ncbi:MAG: hypothetical protein HY903_12685 [Deltaproteobacteria bacterium]|nr:hypothetical protein [Deltaproteobacteria bacterium]
MVLAALSMAPGACAEANASLQVELSSPLSIPGETNELNVQVSAAGTVIGRGNYLLGPAPRDRWPQTLPIVGKDREAQTVAIVFELRMSIPGVAAAVVGYAEAQGELDRDGESVLPVVVPRQCIDADGDGYGVGAGCLGPDCADDLPEVPAVTACAVVGCATANPCGGDRVCFDGVCTARCAVAADCGGSHLTCQLPEGACVCQKPCSLSSECGFCFPAPDNCQVTIGWTCKSSCCAP